MKNLFESIIDGIYYNKVLENYINIEGEEILQLNESFQSDLLRNLAKEIYKVEGKHRDEDKQRAQHYKEQGYFGKPSKNAKSFASIFGPLVEQTRYDSGKTGLQGLKWSDIKDSDFTFIKGSEENNKQLKKAIKPIFDKKQKGNIIVCKPDTKTPIIFIKGYNSKDKDSVSTYYFASKGWKSGVQPMTRTKYSYQERDLKFNEVIEEIAGLDCYILYITDDMIKDYKNIHIGREESRQGMINYDKQSLKNLLKTQKAKYKALAEEIRAKKLQSDPSIFFDEIKQTNDDVVALYQKVVNSPENIDQNFDLSRLMDYVSRAYDYFYRSIKSSRSADKSTERQMQKGLSPADAIKWSSYERKQAESEINDAKEYIDKVKKMIKEIEDNLK